MQPMTNIDGNALFNKGHIACNPYQYAHAKEGISPKVNTRFTQARTAPVSTHTTKGHANTHSNDITEMVLSNCTVNESSLLVHQPHMESILEQPINIS